MATVKVADLRSRNVILKPYKHSVRRAHYEVILVEKLGPKRWVEVRYLGETKPGETLRSEDMAYGSRGTHPGLYAQWKLDPNEEVEIEDGQEAEPVETAVQDDASAAGDRAGHPAAAHRR